MSFRAGASFFLTGPRSSDLLSLASLLGLETLLKGRVDSFGHGPPPP